MSGLAVVTDSRFSSFPYLMSSSSLTLDLSLGQGKQKRSGRNAVCTAESAFPSSPESQSVNTDHAEGTKGLWESTARHTHMQEKQTRK